MASVDAYILVVLLGWLFKVMLCGAGVDGTTQHKANPKTWLYTHDCCAWLALGNVCIRASAAGPDTDVKLLVSGDRRRRLVT